MRNTASGTPAHVQNTLSANCRLIAAAPELHQALTAIMADYRSGLAAIRPSTMNQAVAALAKVEGGAA